MIELGSTVGDLSSVAGLVALTLIFCAYFMALEAAFLSVTGRAAARSQLNKRLSSDVSSLDQLQDLVKARSRRSLSPDGEYTLPFASLNRLLVQSGASWGLTRFPAFFIGVCGVMVGVVYLLTRNFPAALVIGASGGAALLYLLLVYLRGKRRTRLEAQLPDAIDTLVRSLKAGHPVPAAIRLVARELPDPIGTEFGILANELTYGLDLETAMNNMGARVGQEDLALVVVATGVQASTGGNLAEILSGMSKVVRERLRMRLKVKAMSAEGRFSAVILSVLPLGLFAILWVIAPHFYGEIWDLPLVKPVLLATAAWLIIGNIVMYRLVRFEI
ncbi:MAG: type II secretion system F family protein [Rhodospirillales bacterium]|nr:type II secretion system F family protein [Rhodospirillales bacterium]